MAVQLGDVITGTDDDGRETLSRLDAVAECPGCGQDAPCWSDTEEWTQDASGVWRHGAFGPAQGVCERCQMLIVDSWDGCRAYRLGG